MRPDFVFLDAGGTLIRTPSLEEVIARACVHFGMWIEEATLAQAISHALAEMHPPRPNTLDRRAYEQWWWQFVERALGHVGFPGSTERIAAYLWQQYREGRWVQLFPDTLDALTFLLERGYRLGVLSNWDDTLERFLTELGIREYFECVVSSYLAGVEKPDPGIFLYALRQVGLQNEPSRVVHVGDDIVFDYLGALAAGVRPVLVDYTGKLAGATGQLECPIVRTLSEAARLIVTLAE